MPFAMDPESEWERRNSEHGADYTAALAGTFKQAQARTITWMSGTCEFSGLTPFGLVHETPGNATAVQNNR